MLQNVYQQYQNNSIMTATPAELTRMLYNGAIKFVNQGIESIEKKDLASAHTYIIKAQCIMEELRATLDVKYEIGQQMDKLYVFIIDLLIQGNIKKDMNVLNQANDFIREFRDVWQQIMKQAPK